MYEHLHVSLRLLESAHDTKCAEQVAIRVGGEARNDGVVWPFPGAQAVGVLWVQYEAVASVLESEAAALRNNACSDTIAFQSLNNISALTIQHDKPPQSLWRAPIMIMVMQVAEDHTP